jgi:hypothetical protein
VGSIDRRAGELLECLRELVPYDAGWIALRDPSSREHVALATDGDSAPLKAYFATPGADDDLESLGLNHQRPPVRAGDLPLPLGEVRAWAEFLLPAGFTDGFAVGLFTADGRHLGFLSLLVEGRTALSDAAVDVVNRLRPMLASAIDRLPSLAAAADLVDGALGGVVLTRSGGVLPLPGLPGHPLLVAGSPVLAVAEAQSATGRLLSTFLSPWVEQGPTPGHLRVTVLDCRRHPPDHLCAVVLVHVTADLRRLTGPELEYLGLLLEGRSDVAIAAQTAHDVTTLREQIRRKLREPTQELALLRAARDGLYVPSALQPPRWHPPGTSNEARRR